jgi:hypothetical protein
MANSPLVALSGVSCHIVGGYVALLKASDRNDRLLGVSVKKNLM